MFAKASSISWGLAVAARWSQHRRAIPEIGEFTGTSPANRRVSGTGVVRTSLCSTEFSRFSRLPIEKRPGADREDRVENREGQQEMGKYPRNGKRHEHDWNEK